VPGEDAQMKDDTRRESGIAEPLFVGASPQDELGTARPVGWWRLNALLSDLCLEALLHHALYNVLEEVGIGQQDLLRQLRVHLTMIMGHRRPLSMGCLQTPTILKDIGLLSWRAIELQMFMDTTYGATKIV
jgi:hypothetical protein